MLRDEDKSSIFVRLAFRTANEELILNAGLLISPAQYQLFNEYLPEQRAKPATFSYEPVKRNIFRSEKQDTPFPIITKNILNFLKPKLKRETFPG